LTSFTPEPLGEYRVKAPKLDWLLHQLQNIKRQKEKAIIFCEFREMQRLLQHYIHESFGLKPPIINGETATVANSATSRQKQIRKFQGEEGFGVLILSPLAVGFGVNIQAANHVIHYTRTWNPAKEDQATDRAYRIGQQKDVFVYYPTVCAEDFTTFDVRLDELLEKKRGLAGDMLNGTGDVEWGSDLTGMGPDGGGTLDERITIERIEAMEPRYFEALVAAIWCKKGFTCTLTPQSGDHGVDVIARQDDNGILIQVKKASEGRALGWDAVKEVVGGEAFYCQQYPGIAFKKIALTNQFFNDTAKEQAQINEVELLEQAWLEQSLGGHVIMMSELDLILS
jgi:Holliday junction resolvase